MNEPAGGLRPQRSAVSNLDRTAERLVTELDVPPGAHPSVMGRAYIDGIGTLVGLDRSDLVEVSVILAKKVIEERRRSGPPPTA